MTLRSFGFTVFIVLWAAVGFAAGGSPAAPPAGADQRSGSPVVFSNDISNSMMAEAARVGEEFHTNARSLFARTPLGWDLDTIDYIVVQVTSIPRNIPSILQQIREQSRLLGIAGSLFMLALISAALYSLFLQKRVVRRMEHWVQPTAQWIPTEIFPYFLALVRVAVCSLVPLILLGSFSLVYAFVPYRADWWLFIQKVLILWAIGAASINLLREVLFHDLFPVAPNYGKILFHICRIVLIYILTALAVVQGAKAFGVRADVQAFIRFVISLTIVCALIPLLLKKGPLLSLLPDLPYRYYQTFVRALERYYFPVIFFTFLTGLMWCFGYKDFSRTLWIKTWAVAGSFVLIMVTYHILNGRLKRWIDRHETQEEEAVFLFGSLRSLLMYATVVATILVAFNLLGFLEPIRRVLSFPFLRLGGAPLSIWIVLKAILILVAFIYVTRLLQAYLTYKIYPALGIEPGLAYVLNTFLRYLGLLIGVLFSLGVVGIDLRIFMVFAGAVGIGIGLGLQTMASNLISGFSLVFGRKLRKDDWIQVDNTRGVVTDIFLRATKVRTRDNVEYLIPNADFISKSFVNYTLSSPMIRIRIPVNVSYRSDPEQVRRILLEVAARHPEVNDHQEPEISFAACGENAIEFELLIWIDIRRISEWRIRSRLYFDIFEAFKTAGIEIPLPQRDLYIRSAVGWPEPQSR
ncbi:MAG: mechanosensitive ion channel [Desulfobacterales bacterium]|jgi:small-conductance mechanosensitive channel